MYGGYYGAWGYHSNDWMWGVAIGTTVAVVALSADDDDDDVTVIQQAAPAGTTIVTAPGTTTTITTTANGASTTAVTANAAPAPTMVQVIPQATLPCAPVTKEVEGTTYYQCAQQHYVLAYGGAGPIYMPVPPPVVPAAPAAPAAAPPATPAAPKPSTG
jgi:hypothetical protein